MAERSIDELGPVDYLIVEFPPGAQNVTVAIVAPVASVESYPP